MSADRAKHIIELDLMTDVRDGEYDFGEIYPDEVLSKMIHIVCYDVNGGGTFDVICNGAIAGRLTYGEMMETVIFNLLPAPKRGYEALTREQIAIKRAARKEMKASKS